MQTNHSRLKRPKNKMPDDIRDALEKNNLMKEYQIRPAYQQNDYIGWIVRAKQAATRQKRLEQMLHELEIGGIYMNMEHPASSKGE